MAIMAIIIKSRGVVSERRIKHFLSNFYNYQGCNRKIYEYAGPCHSKCQG